MKRIFIILGKIFLFLLVSVLIIFTVLKISFNDKLPTGTTGPAADQLAFKMLDAIHHKEYTQAQEIHWTFKDHKYEWKLQQGAVDVYWNDYKVNLVTAYPQISFAWKAGKKLSGQEFDDALQHAQHRFNNDSFWMVAPHKIFDPGVTRSLVEIDGSQQLLITYNSGGSTPGDSYLWQLDDNGLPISFKMWVDIIPLNAVPATWDDWKMTTGGFPLPRKRAIYGLEIPISHVKVIP